MNFDEFKWREITTVFPSANATECHRVRGCAKASPKCVSLNPDCHPTAPGTTRSSLVQRGTLGSGCSRSRRPRRPQPHTLCAPGCSVVRATLRRQRYAGQRPTPRECPLTSSEWGRPLATLRGNEPYPRQVASLKRCLQLQPVCSGLRRRRRRGSHKQTPLARCVSTP